jgi:Ankyrin repeat
MTSPFHRALPLAADLAQQKTQAKELLHSFSAGHTESIARVRAVLPDKSRIVLADAQFVLAREYGFRDWNALRTHISDRIAAERGPHEQMHDAMLRRDAARVRQLLSQHAEFRPLINAPFFPYNSPAIVACADDAALVDVLLEFGADPNQRSGWWAGGFHALHSATGAAAERLLAAGAIPDACAAAHLDDATLLGSMLAVDATRVGERGGDGQTPLHFARSRRVIDLLLDKHAGCGLYAERSPSSFHIYFWTIGANRSPLDVAAQFGHDPTVNAMLEFATPAQRLRLACRRADGDAARAGACGGGSVAAERVRADRIT